MEDGSNSSHHTMDEGTRFFRIDLPKGLNDEVYCNLEVRYRNKGSYIFKISGLFRKMKMFEYNTISRLEPGEYEVEIMDCNPPYTPRPRALRFAIEIPSTSSSESSSSSSLASLEIGHVRMHRERQWGHQGRFSSIVVLLLAIVFGYRAVCQQQHAKEKEKEEQVSASTPVPAYTPPTQSYESSLIREQEKGIEEEAKAAMAALGGYEIVKEKDVDRGRGRATIVSPIAEDHSRSGHETSSSLRAAAKEVTSLEASTTTIPEEEGGEQQHLQKEEEKEGITPSTENPSTPVKLPGDEGEWRSLFSKIYSSEETPDNAAVGGSRSSRRLEPVEPAEEVTSWMDDYWLGGPLEMAPPPPAATVSDVDSSEEDEEYQKTYWMVKTPTREISDELAT